LLLPEHDNVDATPDSTSKGRCDGSWEARDMVLGKGKK